MIDEALEVFKKIYDKEGEELVVNKHIPKDGTYILVNIKSGKIIEKLNIFYDKKTKDIEGKYNQYYDYIRAFDYYSNIIGTNKALDLPRKKIHSNQLYSFFVKKETILKEDLKESVIKYKKNALNPEKRYKGKDMEIYKNIENDLLPIDKETGEKIFSWIEDNITKPLILEKSEEYLEKFFIKIEKDKNEDYLKIFFVEDDLDKSLELFRNEYKRYLIPNIYNKNDYNQKIENKIYGLPNTNMTLNSDKPFLENKTRKIGIPYLVDIEEILLQYVFYNYLIPELKQGNNFIYFSDDKIIPKTNKEPCPSEAKYLLNASYSKNIDIKNFNIISKNSSKKREINFKEILPEKNNNSKIEYGNLDKVMVMELVDKFFFNSLLLGNIFNDAEDIKVRQVELKKLLINYKNGLYKWFYLRDELEIKKSIKKLYLDSIIVNIKTEYDKVSINNQFNLGFCLEVYFYGKSELMEEIMNVKEVFLNHTLSEEDWNLSNDDEYFWAVGQILSYINSKRNTKNKNLNFIVPILSIKSINILKERVFNIIKSYAHLINSKKVSRTISNINIYEPKEIKKFILLAGFTADRALYSSSKNKEEEE